MSLIEDLNWRHACKQMNGKEVEQSKVDTILESIRLAPTSMGLQAFKVFVIKDKDLINQIFEKTADKQKMLPNCSHLLVFAAYTQIKESDVNEYLELIATTRNITLESLAGLKEMFGGILSMPEMEVINWTSRQTYIAMGYATVAAATLGVDSTPIEGFSIHALNKLLDLPSQGLTATLMLPLGYMDEENDYLANAAKVRKTTADLFINK